MPKVLDEDTEVVNIRLFKSDLDFLRTNFSQSSSNTGYAMIVRNIVRSFVRAAKARADAQIDQSENQMSAEDLL